MKIFVVIAALATIANAGLAPIVIIPSAATTLLRSPALDSAVVQSERLGGNFAYAIAEGQQFQSVAPIVSDLVRLIGPTGIYSSFINRFRSLVFGAGVAFTTRRIVRLQLVAIVVATGRSAHHHRPAIGPESSR